MATIAMLKLENNNKKTPRHLYFRRFSGQSINNWLNDLSKIDWKQKIDQNISKSPLETYDNSFAKIMDNLTEKHFPLLKKKYRKYTHKKSNWMTNQILQKIKARDKLYKKQMKTKDKEKFNSITKELQLKNKELKLTIRDQKNKYYHEQFCKNKNDVRKKWETIKEVLNKPKSSKYYPEYFEVNNQKVFEKSDIASHFNNFFTNIGPKLAQTIDTENKPSYKQYLNKIKVTSTFTFKLVNENEVTKMITNLKPKHSRGTDNISTILLKLATPAIISPLTRIINQSLKNGIFPNKLKIAKIIPIFKKGDQHSLDNYRPISILPAISKIFEKIVCIQVYDYFCQNKLFFPNQYGFREKHSTELALLEFVDRIHSDLDNKRSPFAIYIDLSKAFDTIDHEILINKLHHYGIKNTELLWFKSYLKNRKQYTEIDNNASPHELITTGVPQGSILGPLLFLIYINDLSRSTKFKSIMFADDTTLYSTLEHFDNTSMNMLTKSINNEVKNVSNWLAINKLSLNVQKTKAMFFSFKQHQHPLVPILPEIKINDISIENVDSFKFLGVYIDKNLNWQSHINYIGNKLSQINGTVCRLKNTLPTDTLRMIYFALFYPHLIYGLTCWGFSALNQTNRIIKLQKKVVRNITKSKYNAHTSKIFKSLNLLKFIDIIKISCIKFFYKYKHNLLPQYFENFLEKPRLNALSRPQRNTQPPRHLLETELDTQHNHLIPTIHTNTKSARHCLKHNMITMINNKSIPQDIIDKIKTLSFHGIAVYSRKNFIKDYQTECLIPQCYICRSV
jgi:hypothetical protein